MKFYVQGSAVEPYRIVTEGEGETFKIFCSCPAGRKGGKFCKHVAALLVGDVTKLVEGSDDPAALKGLTEGSGLVAKAVGYAPERRYKGDEECDRIFASTGSIAFAAAGLVRSLQNKGWQVLADRGALSIAGFFKNGKPRRGPAVALLYVGEDVEIDGAVMPGNRTRPFYVSGSTFATLAAALDRFAEMEAKMLAVHLPGG
jgi:hypothetical protein